MDQPKETKKSGCGKKAFQWVGLPIGAAIGAIAGAATANFVVWLPIGLALGLLFVAGMHGGS